MVIANITPLFSFITNTFVIVIFSTQLHIVKIIAMYKQKNKFHSYIAWSITDIQELLYVSLQVYTYIQGHIFIDFITNEFSNNFSLFLYCDSKHIIYNIWTTNMQLEENVLFLKEMAKIIFSNLNDIKVHDIIVKF